MAISRLHSDLNGLALAVAVLGADGPLAATATGESTNGVFDSLERIPCTAGSGARIAADRQYGGIGAKVKAVSDEAGPRLFPRRWSPRRWSPRRWSCRAAGPPRCGPHALVRTPMVPAASLVPARWWSPRRWSPAVGPHAVGPHAVGPHAVRPHAVGPRALVPTLLVPTLLVPTSPCEGVIKSTMDPPALASAFLPNKPRTLVMGVLASVIGVLASCCAAKATVSSGGGGVNAVASAVRTAPTGPPSWNACCKSGPTVAKRAAPTGPPFWNACCQTGADKREKSRSYRPTILERLL